MYKAKVKLVYKQVIDETTESGFGKAIFKATYDEFLIKSQTYNMERQFKTFSKIKANDGRANSLHYKLSFAAGHFIVQLHNAIPGIKDNLGNKLTFDTARFELIESHIEDMSLHKLAIHYETAELTLVEVFGEYMLLTQEDPAEKEDAIETFILRMQPDLSVVSYQMTGHQTA